MRKNKPPLMRRFVVFSVAVFLFVLTVGSAVFFFSMRNIVSENKGIELSQMLEIERIKIENSVNSEIAVILKLADSPLIRQYFAYPNDAALENMALDEMASYRNSLKSDSFFWVNDIYKAFHNNDDEPYIIYPEKPENYWYNMTLYETDVYNFNINYNPDLNVTNLWINAPVFDGDRKPLGIVGTGINLSRFITSLYQNYSGDARLYFFNNAGEITGAEDISLVTAKKNIDDELNVPDFDILGEVKELEQGETLIYDTPANKIVAGAIPVLDWYIIAVTTVGVNDYDQMMVVLFLVMLVVIAVILVIFNILIAGFLTSLRNTMDSLEAASTAKSHFLANMSHEIRTPMNAIIGITQIQLQNENLPDEYAAALEKIYSSGNILLGIINDILDMSKIETGRLELNPVNYDTPSLISDAVQLNIIRIGSKPIQFALDINENLPLKMYGDELRIKQVLNNLLSNAIKYTDKGSVRLSVSHTAQGGDIILKFTVADTGQGIKPEDKEKLFSEYLRLNAAANRTTEGTGLGLNITKQLVGMMGGVIEVESEYGKGSVFSVTLKQKAVEDAVIGAEISERLRNFTFTVERQHAKTEVVRELMPYGSVLIVDDVEINLLVAEGLLSPYGLKIETASSGYAAVEMVKSGKTFDIIFMDHMMPNMDGIEATRRLREYGYTGAIVALTADALAGNDEMFMQNGFNGFISKPIDIRRLNEVLNEIVRDKNMAEPAGVNR